MDFPKYAKIGASYNKYVPELNRYCTNGGAWPADESLVKSRIFSECSYHDWAKDQHPEWYDWKWISQQEGYKSIKKDYIRQLNYKYASKRDKEEAVELMKNIISMATHYSYHLEKPIHLVLAQWEKERTYNWRNYYINKERINAKKFKPKSLKALKRYYKNHTWYKVHKERGKKLYQEEVTRIQRLKRKESGKKARWTKERRKRGY